MHPPTSTDSMSTRVQHPHRVSGHIPSHLVSAPRSSIKTCTAPRTRDPMCAIRALAVRDAHAFSVPRCAPNATARRRQHASVARDTAPLAGALTRSGPAGDAVRAAAHAASGGARSLGRMGCRRFRLPRRRGRRMGVGRARATDAAAGPVALGEDVLPGHPQCSGCPGARRLDLHQARRPQRHGRGPCPERLDPPLRPQRHRRPADRRAAGGVVPGQRGAPVGRRAR